MNPIWRMNRWQHHMHFQFWVWPHNMDHWGSFANIIEVYSFYFSMTFAFGCNYVELWSYMRKNSNNIWYILFGLFRCQICFPSLRKFIVICLCGFTGVTGFHHSSVVISFGQLLSRQNIPMFLHIVHGRAVISGFPPQWQQGLADFIRGWGLVPDPWSFIDEPFGQTCKDELVIQLNRRNYGHRSQPWSMKV